MKSADIRRKFLEFFKARGHQEVSSSPLVPADDPTLLFTNAGMVQFKRVFQGLERHDYSRATTCQKCVRAGGKHNDLEQVGHTARHHTFFEMLGNFSFGDYFKQDAIAYAWEWVTSKEWLGIDPARLYISVHTSDEEATGLWKKVDKHLPIFALGDKDNFWQMGDTGPAGPCSEIFVDLRGQRKGELSTGQFEALQDAGHVTEIWNLVFMQYDLQKDGSRVPLPKPSVDTGAGLERISAVLQNVPSNFDTDLFVPLIERAVEVVGRPYERGPEGAPYRVLADHARAVAFLLADGVYPSSDGRGYVLRRILRRAVRHAWVLGRHEPTLVHIALRTVELMGGVYPELLAKREHIEKVVQAEEERFLETIAGGLRRMEEIKGATVITGEDAFKLYDTYGFPLDLTQMIAAERGQKVDAEGFEVALAQQRRRSRAARAVGTGGAAPAVPVANDGAWIKVKPKASQRWIGYEATKAETSVVEFRQQGDRVELVLEENPFYAQSGGQVSDTGVVKGQGWELTVEDVEKVDGKSAVVGTFGEPIEPTPVLAQVNETRRKNIERNHTATHLVHAALRKILGPHVRQAGSVVAPDRLRFDFSHHGPIADDVLATIEEEVNAHVWANAPVTTREMKYKDALGTGAMALFGEKYGDLVRVVEVPGVSIELCGGTHVAATGELALFRFTHETGAAAGVRRIEAITGPAAYRYARELEARLDEAAALLKSTPEHLAKRVEAMLEEQKKLEKRLEDMLRKGGATDAGEVREIPGGPHLRVVTSDIEDKNQIALMMDTFRTKYASDVTVILPPATGSQHSIHVGVPDALLPRVKAGELVQFIVSSTGGRGGGRPHFASGSMTTTPSISTLIALVSEYLGKKSDSH